MLAGSLAKLGYFMGHELRTATDSNPKGFFEDYEIIRINEALIRQTRGCAPFPSGQGWIAAVPRHVEVVTPRVVAWRMRAQASARPFCFKDPRFCYTLPAWLRLLPEIVVLCVFREPARTANSVVKECAQPYHDTVEMDFERALMLWQLMYGHVLDHYNAGVGRFVFAHYEQVLDGSAARRVSRVLGGDVDPVFPDVALRRSSAQGAVGADVQGMYERLCSLAGYAP